MALFNVRVYGLLINERDEILISDEQEYGMCFTKFPGGGLEFGEGLTEGLKREFMEECNVEIVILSHFYTTDFFVKSAFNDSQIISVYYLVKNISGLNLSIKTKVFDFELHQIADPQGQSEVLRWVEWNELTEESVSLPIDKIVVRFLKNTHR